MEKIFNTDFDTDTSDAPTHRCERNGKKRRQAIIMILGLVRVQGYGQLADFLLYDSTFYLCLQTMLTLKRHSLILDLHFIIITFYRVRLSFSTYCDGSQYT